MNHQEAITFLKEFIFKNAYTLNASDRHKLLDIAYLLNMNSAVLDGLSQDAIDGGFTVKRLQDYAKNLEQENKLLFCFLSSARKELEKYQWISAIDKFPENEQRVYVIFRKSVSLVSFIYWNDIYKYSITHWMPLPPLPESENV